MIQYSTSLFGLLVTVISVTPALGQNYERYRPLRLPNRPVSPTKLKESPPPTSGSDKTLLAKLDAVVVCDSGSRVQPSESNQDAQGIVYRYDDQSSLVHSAQFQSVVEKHLGQPVSLRSLNQLSRDIIELYRTSKQPVVDVQIPEQKITGGTVQIVVVESRIGEVKVSGGSYFGNSMVSRWVQSTRPGSRIFEPRIEDDLFWLNQNPFRTVGVKLQPGKEDGTTDVLYQVSDSRPVQTYFGYDDTGVESLNQERLTAGFIYGNLFGRDGILSYQYTADSDFHRLHAHAFSWNQPLSRDYSFQTYGSWAGVDPELSGVFSQNGESWQAGFELIRHLTKNRWIDESISFGFDFKTTDNNLEFGGQSVVASTADLAQLHLGYSKLLRRGDDAYQHFTGNIYIGPGGGFSSGNNTAAFSSVRANTTPDYIYAKAKYVHASNVGAGDRWRLKFKAVGQISSERLLFSETLGIGGYDTIRGYDQRTANGDHGWITSLEFGPRPLDLQIRKKSGQLRYYTFLDLGTIYTEDPVAGEQDSQFLWSTGVGARLAISRSMSLRFDYGYGFEDVAGLPNDRVHVGFVKHFGSRR